MSCTTTGMYRETGVVLGNNVYQVEKNGKHYAKKVLTMELSVCSFEISFMLNHRSQHIIRGLEHTYENAYHCLIMELGGENLEAAMYKGRKCTDDDIFSMLHALAYLQENGIEHADIKPPNFIFRQGTLVLADFGLSCLKSKEKRMAQSLYCCSPQNFYLNLIMLGKDVSKLEDEMYKQDLCGDDKVGDVWSLACCIVFALSGYDPFISLCGIEGVAHKLESFSKNREEYLSHLGVEKRWFPLLLPMLEPSYEKRVKNVSLLIHASPEVCLWSSFPSSVERLKQRYINYCLTKKLAFSDSLADCCHALASSCHYNPKTINVNEEELRFVFSTLRENLFL